MIEENKQTKQENQDEFNFNMHCNTHESIKECMGECKVQYYLKLFGKKYTMPIIRLLLLNKSLRFNEISNELKGSPKTITARLRNLEKNGLIKRRLFDEVPMRVEYSLTKKVKSLDSIFENFAQWAYKN